MNTRIVEAYQIPKGSVSHDIFALPCIDGCGKNHADGSVFYFTIHTVKPRLAYPGEWLCKDDKGKWHVLTDKEYRKEVMP